MRGMLSKKRLVPALMFLVALAACQRSRAPAASAADLRQVLVTNVTIEVGVGSPIPVDAFVSGEWPDPCAQLTRIEQRLDGNTFEITLLATAADPDCPPDAVGLPFRIAIPINVVRLAEGTHTVRANGVATTFEVPVSTTHGE